MNEKRFVFNGATNCIEYDGKSILLDSYGDEIEELLNELHEKNEELAKDNLKTLALLGDVRALLRMNNTERAIEKINKFEKELFK